MSHKITSRDLVLLAKIPALFDGKGWHGLGIPTEDFSKGNPELTKILFTYRMQNAGIMSGTEFVPTGERYAVSQDDNLPIGDAVGERWATPQNEELFDLFTKALEGSQYKICSLMTLDGRVQFAIDATSGEMKAGSRTIKPFVGLHRSFGGKGALQICGHSTVMQCANTTALFLSETARADDVMKARNTLGIFDKLPEIKRTLDKIYGVTGEFAAAMAESENVKVTTEAAVNGFVGFLGQGRKDFQLSAKAIGRANRLLELFKTGKGSSGGNNLADWFNAATELFTHESAGRIDLNLKAEAQTESRVKQYMSSEFGSGRNIKSDLATVCFKGPVPNKFAVANFAKEGRAAIERTNDKELLADLVMN